MRLTDLARPQTSLSRQLDFPLRIIVADDSVVSRRAIELALDELGFNVQLVSDGLAAWELLLAEDVPTIAILDWMMPGFEGIELCRKVRQLSRQHYIYTMLLTGRTEKAELVEGLRAGADDYITKPFDVDEIRGRLLVAERIIGFQEELLAARDAMKKQACHDYLTQLLNRGGIMEALDQELNRSRRSGVPFSVILADIDHFKRVNDSYGHLSGDSILVEVASRIKSCVRSYDSVGRYGGEEFLIILPDCNEAAALQAAERMRKAVCASSIFTSGTGLEVTISLGVNTRHNEISLDTLLSPADAALYRAKAGGRNCTFVAPAAGVALPQEIVHS